jgi:hypothetical protein
MLKSVKYVCRAVSNKGWRIWKRNHGRGGDWWGNFFKEFPSELIDELNGEHRPEKIVELTKKYERKTTN